MPKSFGSFVRSIIDEIIPVGNNFAVEDAAETPVTSPVTITAGSTQLLTIPTNAAEVIINSDDDVMLGLDSSFTEYDRIPAGIPANIQCGKLSTMYLKNAGSASITVYFRFVQV